jgi:hypothetical protein
LFRSNIGNNSIKVCIVNLVPLALSLGDMLPGFPFSKVRKFVTLPLMAKATKKTPKEASNLFHNIMAASVKGNPKPVTQPKKDKPKKK